MQYGSVVVGVHVGTGNVGVGEGNARVSGVLKLTGNRVGKAVGVSVGHKVAISVQVNVGIGGGTCTVPPHATSVPPIPTTNSITISHGCLRRLLLHPGTTTSGASSNQIPKRGSK